MEKFPSWKEIEDIVNAQKKYLTDNEQSPVVSPVAVSMDTQLLNLKALSVKVEIEKNIAQYREENYSNNPTHHINDSI